MAIETNELIDVQTLSPFKKFIMTIGNIPTSYLESMTYAELLMWFCNYLQETVIPTVNNNAEAVEELQGLYEQLKQYVNDYFENLDVQEEINNKLDEMTESGQLTYIIKNYVDDVFEPYQESINNQFDAYKTSINTQLSTTNANVSANSTNINTLSGRIDAFTNLTEGSTTGDAELIDGRTSYSGIEYPNIGDAIRGQTNILLTKIDTINNDSTFMRNYFDGIYVSGLYKSADGSFDSTRVDYVSNKNKILTNGCKCVKVITPSSFTLCYVMFYQADDTYISYSNTAHQYPTPIPANTNYIRVSIKNPNDNTIAPNEVLPFTLYLDNFEIKTKDLIENNFNINHDVFPLFQNFIYVSQYGNYGQVANRIGMLKPIQLKEDKLISCASGYKFSWSEFSELTPYGDKTKETSFHTWTTSPTKFNKGDIILINFAKSDDTDIAPDEITNLSIVPYYEDTILGNNYVIDSVMNKTNISLTSQGTLTGWQSFCMYNNNIYCTDGSHIYVYNSNYELQNTVDLYVGHGNSMQLGHNGKCYISGWNNNRIYEVDLSTLTITNTIVLPSSITGLTTCCVDDLNNIAYIFNAPASSSSTEVNYTFIAYDYNNEEILYSKVIDKFGAMQSCDFIDGKILALNGLGNGTVPNKYRYFNTQGDVIGEYILGSYSTGYEPEGCFIDRNTKDVYIGLNTYVYKITQ